MTLITFGKACPKDGLEASREACHICPECVYTERKYASCSFVRPLQIEEVPRGVSHG